MILPWFFVGGLKHLLGEDEATARSGTLSASWVSHMAPEFV